jgi:hypothetical protein
MKGPALTAYTLDGTEERDTAPSRDVLGVTEEGLARRVRVPASACAATTGEHLGKPRGGVALIRRLAVESGSSNGGSEDGWTGHVLEPWPERRRSLPSQTLKQRAIQTWARRPQRSSPTTPQRYSTCRLAGCNPTECPQRRYRGEGRGADGREGWGCGSLMSARTAAGGGEGCVFQDEDQTWRPLCSCIWTCRPRAARSPLSRRQARP